MSTGMDKGTTNLLSWALYSCNWKTWLQVCPWRKALQNQFLSVTSNTGTPELWCIPNKLVLRKDTDIIYVAMGGGSKKFLHLLRKGGSKSFSGLQRGSKKFDDKNFQLPSPPPTKVFMNTPQGRINLNTFFISSLTCNSTIFQFGFKIV